MARAVLPHRACGPGGGSHPSPQGARAAAGLASPSPDPGGHLSGLPSAASRANPKEARWGPGPEVRVPGDSCRARTAAGVEVGAGVLVRALLPSPLPTVSPGVRSLCLTWLAGETREHSPASFCQRVGGGGQTWRRGCALPSVGAAQVAGPSEPTALGQPHRPQFPKLGYKHRPQTLTQK